jgi:hypothetical protein
MTHRRLPLHLETNKRNNLRLAQKILRNFNLAHSQRRSLPIQPGNTGNVRINALLQDDELHAMVNSHDIAPLRPETHCLIGCDALVYSGNGQMREPQTVGDVVDEAYEDVVEVC